MTEVETVVIMVTDLVGSTALGSRLGATGFEDFRQEHDSTLRDIGEDFGGRVIKNTGDGLLVAFASVAGALDSAVAIQQRLERRNRRAEVATMVRIGISIGDASVEDGDYFGLPPIEASRLCAQAGGSEILIADSVRAVLRGPGKHVLESAGALALKGLPDAVVAWRVLWKPLPDSAGPLLPARLRGAADTAHVGRAPERLALLETWGRALGGQRQMVVISGEAGIGKTRLVTEIAQTALPDHAVVLYGRCDEDQGMPYYPWLEILREYVEIAPRRLLRPYASELSRLVPGLSRRLAIEATPTLADPQTERYLLFNAVQSVFAAATELAPLLVIVDDLHWADRPTLLLLKHLVTSSSAGRLMLLGTFRDSDVGPEHPLPAVLADLHREPGVARIALTGLADEEIVDLVEELAGHSIDAAGRALAGEVHRETAGNPFFVGELVRHLSETGVILPRSDGGWSFGNSMGGHGLPASVREVIEQRVQRLSAQARRVLGVAAVIGGDFDLELVARAAGLPGPEVLDGLDEAMAASLLTKTAMARTSFVGPRLTEVYAFSHGLVQATLYGGLPSGRRAVLHQAVGEAIEQVFAEEIDARLPDLAHHFLAGAAVGDSRRAVDYAARAGEQAMGQFAYDQATRLFARALAVPGGDPGGPRIALLQALGDAQMRAGDSDAARRTLFEAAAAAQRHDAPAALARAVRACGIWGITPGVDEELVGLAEEAIKRLEGRGSPRLIAEIKGLLAGALYYAPPNETERRERLATEALDAARAEHALAGDRASMQTLAYVIGRYLLARSGPDSATGDVALTEELLGLCRELGDVELELLARQGRTTALLELGDFAALDQEVARMEHMAEELRQPRAMASLPLHRGVLAMAGGRFAEAERRNTESIELGSRIPGSISVVAAYSQLMLVRLLQGRLAEFEELLRAMAEAYPEMLGYRCGLVVLLLQAERRTDARAEFERVIGPGVSALPRDNTYILMLALLAEAAVELEDEPRAQDLYQALSPYSRRWVVLAGTGLLWPVDRSLGRLATAIGAEEEAFAYLDTARRAAQEADALPSAALVALDEARLLARRGSPGDRGRARRRAGDARLLAQGIGMPELAREAGRLQGDLAARVASSGPSPRPGAVRVLAPE